MKIQSLFLSVIFINRVTSDNCKDENVEYDGQAHQSSISPAPAECEAKCQSGRCSYWSWRDGTCTILKLASPGNKVGVLGAVSGSKKPVCSRTVSGLACQYADNSEPVVCLFPYITEAQPGRTSPDQHDVCSRSADSLAWCPTKLSMTGRVVQSSQEGRSVHCNQLTNSRGEAVCPPASHPAGSCQPDTARLLAEQQLQNQDLLGWLAEVKCGSGWSSWGSWSTCNLTTPVSCPASQSRKRMCLSSKPCKGPAIEDRLCAGQEDCDNRVERAGNPRDSCAGRCGQTAPLGQCQCSPECETFGDCCRDFSTVCSGAVVTPISAASTTTVPIAASTGAPQTSPAVKPPTTTSVPQAASGATDADLADFSERLLALDENNVADKIVLNTGCTTRVGNPNDCSSNRLFAQVDTAVFRRPTYEKLLALYGNYDADVTQREDNTRQEQAEEADFLNEILKTKVMKETMAFLKAKKLFTKSEAEFKALLRELWFGVYSRGNRILGSSGFEHVFLGEKKDGKVQGFHNWVYFYHLEQNNQVNYLGHWNKVEMSRKGTGLSFTFLWGKEQKPFASFLVGTSPEFELAIYTTCLLARNEDRCPLQLGGQKFGITTHVFTRPQGVRYIASSYMDWTA